MGEEEANSPPLEGTHSFHAHVHVFHLFLRVDRHARLFPAPNIHQQHHRRRHCGHLQGSCGGVSCGLRWGLLGRLTSICGMGFSFLLLTASTT
jgi:hypothetical protein